MREPLSVSAGYFARRRFSGILAKSTHVRFLIVVFLVILGVKMEKGKGVKE